MIGFEHQVVLVGLIAVPLWWLWRRHQDGRAAIAHAPLQFGRGSSGRRRAELLARGLGAIVLTLAVVGVAEPYTESRFERFEDEGIDIVLALDVSLSMLAEDFPPNRLDALQRIAHDFLERSGGHRVALVIFAGDAYVQSPLTTDRPALFELLAGVTAHSVNQSKSGGTAIGDALLVASERLTAQAIAGRDQAIVLITDGASNEGIEPELAVDHLNSLDIRLYAIGVGGDQPVEVFFEGGRVGGDDDPYLAVLDDTELRALAERAGGRYDRATDVAALENLFAALSRLESAPLEVREVARRRHLTPQLALAALIAFIAHILAAASARRPLR
ncbi:MAG: VWA domain-containing protein [Acidobacteriota bacterium]